MTRSAAGPESANRSIPRVDAREKILGQTRFGVDVYPADCLHGRVIRSSIPHGRIRSIRFAPEIDWSPFTIVTARDIPGRNTVPIIKDDQPFLAGDVVKFAGEPILLLAHPDPQVLAGAHRHVRIEYEEWPACLDLDDALAVKAVVFGGDNVFYQVRIRKGDAAAAKAFEGCRLVEGVYETGLQEQLYLEPQNMRAEYRDGRLRVTGSLQCPYYVKPAVEAALGFPVDVEQAPTGGAFGGKEDYPSLLGAWAALLAWRSKKTVKMVFDREEDVAFTTKRHPSRSRIRMAVDEAGRIQALDIEFLLDGGAYCTLSPVVLSRGSIHIAGAYNCPNVEVRGRVLATNTPPNGAFRGFGAPQAFFAMERHMDRAARTLGLDPLEFRRINLLRDGQTTATGQPFVWQKNLDGVLQQALDRSRYPERVAEYEEWNRGHDWRKRGIGLALFFHGCGFTGSGEKKMSPRARLELDRSGTAWIRVANVEMGQGARTVLASMVAGAMGIGHGRVTFPNPDTALVPNSGPTVASRTTFVVGGVLERAARQLRERLERLANRRWETDSEYSALLGTLSEDIFPLTEEAEYVPPPGVVWDETEFRGHAYADYAWACYVAEVEADLRDYSVRPLRVTAVQDIGTVIHPELARGQVEGGIVQGIGEALLEKVHCKAGRVINAGFSDYIISAAADVPEIECVFIENPSPYGGSGAKGLGELPLDGAAVAVANALSRALNVDIDTIPVLPPDIMERLR